MSVRSEEIPLRILICDSDEKAVATLVSTLNQKDIVIKKDVARTIGQALSLLSKDDYNTIFIDPLNMDLERGSQFILEVRKNLPNIVFVLYVDQAKVEENSAEFYRGERFRFNHYYYLDKGTSVASFSDELESVLNSCQRWLFRSISQETLCRFIEEAKQTLESKEEYTSAKIDEMKDVLSTRDSKQAFPSKPNSQMRTVFLSCRFAEKEYVNGLCELLRQNDFKIVTGKEANTYISKAILDRIKKCEFFISLMTQYAQKSDGKYITSPWLLEEKGAALAFEKRIILMVEENVVDIGGLQGDWQRINFNSKGFLLAALQAVEQLKSYLGEK
ncbi:MAG: hypothetical protein PHS80_06950 [Methanothrix sp.]|nr:hypothetical protein [Methanothrix sp.]MDD4446366.1 hypothetical protein [Methanothrix sp.]